jgi:hypothetical protein
MRNFLKGPSRKKVCEIISLNERFGPNYTTLLEFLKSAVKSYKFVCGVFLDLKLVHPFDLPEFAAYL